MDPLQFFGIMGIMTLHYWVLLASIDRLRKELDQLHCNDCNCNQEEENVEERVIRGFNNIKVE